MLHRASEKKTEVVSLTVKNKTKEARPLQAVIMWVERGRGGSRVEVFRRENGGKEGQRWEEEEKRERREGRRNDP